MPAHSYFSDGGPDVPDTLDAPRVPCTRACRHTLWWPVATSQQSHAAVVTVPGRAAAPLVYPPVPQPPPSLLATCGEPGLRDLVWHHMRRLKMTPFFAQARDCFECVAERVADFVVEACGGPQYFSLRHAPLKAGAGLPLLFDQEGRELWLVQLWHAFDDADFPREWRAELWNWAEPLSIRLLAPHARGAQVARYPYATVRGWFAGSTRRSPHGHDAKSLA